MEHPRDDSTQVIHEIQLNNSSIYFLYRSRANCKLVTVYTAWLREKLGLVLMGGAGLSKSLLQFSIDVWGCVPSLLFDLRPNYGGGNEDNGELLQKVPCTHCCTECPDSAAGHQWPMPLPETPGHSMARLGQSPLGSLLLSPGSGVHKVLFVPSKSLFPESCVSSGSSMVVLMATSSKRAYVIPRSAAPRAAAPVVDRYWTIPLQETLKHSSGSASVGSLSPGVYKVCLNPLRISGGHGVWL